MIAGQYTNYLWRQVDKYLKSIRIHDEDDPDDELLADFSRRQIADIFAYLFDCRRLNRPCGMSPLADE